MKQQNQPIRIFIYTADVRLITGKSERYARRLLKQIREANRKLPGLPVSVFEFCEYMHLSLEHIEPFMH